ncbi:R-SNARE family protein [Legionella parisiensis]|uniref:V-SNARE coiled-coil homology domain-containing protein n=1 Tax=Legionella parisiensis TaxID=45071 RepID=A0A1E5JUA7_9GAMM|nr:R-SNARE family protein [Legionella parisiensis]KTD40783.1 Synaptobrevin [Legionella parisiensis]OEH47953.1 hypothetical protein lpari_01141 [Legionella parisiensis]STX76768.1 Synaptobrevin [Legionella parisiensis]
MRCYALGTSFGDASFDWLISLSNSFLGGSFFEKQIKQTVEKYKEDINLYCSELKPNEVNWTKKGNIYIYAKRLVNDYCVVITDSPLTETQMYWLSFYLLKLQVDKDKIAPNIEKFTEDYKVVQVKKELEDVKQIMLENVEKVTLRGEKIDDLLEKTEQLEASSFQFKKNAEKLNSCWPSCVLL